MDTDLIFDTLEDTKNANNHDRHQSDVQQEEISSKSSQPGEPGQHWFSGTLHRIKRHIGNLLNSFVSKSEGTKRSSRQADDVNYDGQEDYDAQNVRCT